MRVAQREPIPMSAMNKAEIITVKAEIIAELENMVVARLFGRQQWLADRETFVAVHRKLVQMGLMERVCAEPYWLITPLGKEVDVELFEVFIGLVDEWDVVAIILQQYRLLDESEADAIYERVSDVNAESVLRGHVKRAYFDYRKATEFLH
jgi:hypothetical protein